MSLSELFTASPPRPKSARRPQARVRVLHIVQNLNYGGMERVLADIVRGIDQARFETHVLVLQYFGRFAEGLEKWAQLHSARPMSRWSLIWPHTLASQIARIAPHVVHSHSGVWYKASLAARLAGIPRVVHTEHGRRHPDPLGDRVIDAIAARRTDAVVAVSHQLGQHLISKQVVPRRRLHVIPNGIHTEAFRPRPDDGTIRRELGVPLHIPILGSIGRLETIKGYDVMIRAFAMLLAEWPDEVKPVLVVAGEGSDRPLLEQLITALGIESRVHLLGWRDDTQALHASFTAFTMSSRSEGTSISLLEAMSAALCPVVTDVGGNRAVLGEHLAHRLVAPDDPRVLADAMRVVLREPERRAEDGRAARARVESEFSLTLMLQAYEALYAGSRTNRSQ